MKRAEFARGPVAVDLGESERVKQQGQPLRGLRHL